MHYRGQPVGPSAEYRYEPAYVPGRSQARPSSWDDNARLIQLAFLFFTCFAVNSDQLAAAPNLSLISHNFSLSPGERDSLLGALIQFGFFLCAGLFSILSGPAIEVVDRAKLLGGLAAFSSLLACCSGMVPGGRAGYFYFFLLRVSTGVSVGVTLPTALSLLSDLVLATQRTTMAAFVTTSCAGGAAIGQTIAGLSGTSWRVPYFVSACFSLMACALCLLLLKDPRAGTVERLKDRPTERNSAATAWGTQRADPGTKTFSMEDLNWSKFRAVLQVPTNRLIFAQSVPGCIAWSSIATFLPDFIHKELGFTVKASTGVLAVFGISSLFFSFAGSTVGQSIYNQHRNNLPTFVALCMASGAVPMICLVLFGSTNFFTVILAMLGGCAAAAGPNFKGMLMNANPSSDRGTVFAMFNLVDSLGKGLGPTVLVILTWLCGGSRRAAFAIAFGLWFASAWITKTLEDSLNEDTLAVEIKQEGPRNQGEAFDFLHIYHG